MFSLKFMLLFNGPIVTKKLGNIIDIFFRKTLRNKQRNYFLEYFYCTTDIATKWYFSDHSKTLFPVQIICLLKKGKVLVLLLLKSKFE